MKAGVAEIYHNAAFQLLISTVHILGSGICQFTVYVVHLIGSQYSKWSSADGWWLYSQSFKMAVYMRTYLAEQVQVIEGW